jgi:Glycosyl hydrolase family 12
MTRLSPRIVLAAVAAAAALAVAAAVPALTARPAASARSVLPAAAAGTTIYACLTSRHILTRVSVGTPPVCPAGTVPVRWRGQAGPPVPSPSPRASSPSPSPTGTSPAPHPSPTATSPSPGPSPTGAACVTSTHSGNCGPYDYPAISNSNGYTTYVGNNMWGCGPDTNTTSCGPQTVAAHDPGNWSATSTQASGNTAVLTYPNVQQVFTKTTNDDPAISAFTSITSDFTETMNPQAGTDAEAAYDVWLSNTSGPNEIMIWVDNAGRGSGGAQQIATATIGGQAFTVYQYGSGEIIFSMDQNEQSGTVNILATLKWLQGHGQVSAAAQLGQVDFGFEICSTGGKPEKFAVSRYTLTSNCGSAGGCFG